MQTNTANHIANNMQSPLSGGEYLTFILGNEEYGIEILKVQEIRRYEAVTKIANTPDFIKGVINLRGSIVPIIDLRMRFNLSEALYNEFTVVIILNFNRRVTGIVVDGVSDVLDLTNAQISPVPELVSSIETKYLLGLGSVDERMLILIDIERLMTSQEMALVEAITEKEDTESY
jgi:purine-binding chemotaxis protein CheW